MLQNKQEEIKVGDLVVIRFLAGEEMIGTIDDINEKYIYLTKPFRPIMTQQGGLALAPFSVLSDNDTIPISRKHIVSFYPPESEIEKQYLQITSGIDLTTSIQDV